MRVYTNCKCKRAHHARWQRVAVAALGSEPLHFDDDFDLKDGSSLVLEGLAASARDAVRWRGRRQQQSVVAI